MKVSTSTLKYGYESSRQVIKKYQIPGSRAVSTTFCRPRRLILIHGGAWRDPNNTCADFDDFVEFFSELNREGDESGEITVYSIDYDLSSEQRGRFPDVLIEVLKALDAICKDSGGGNSEEFCICGHSVGCTFITQILEYVHVLESAGVPASNFADLKLPKISKAVLLDGIFDIRAMLEEYPSYGFFVAEEFGDEQTAIELCNSVGKVGSGGGPSPGFPAAYKTLKKIVVVHSYEDELLSVRQPDGFLRWLESNGVVNTIEKVYADFGKHNDVYVNERVAELIYKNI